MQSKHISQHEPMLLSDENLPNQHVCGQSQESPKACKHPSDTSKCTQDGAKMQNTGLSQERQHPPKGLPKWPENMPKLPQTHGVLIVHKASGPTSARCLSTLKRLGQKKIGHAGTLDPMAEGVLIVLLGHATKISGHLLTDGNKIYSGTLRLGQESDTWDAEGEIVAEKAWEHISPMAVKDAMQAWLGTSEQQVPPYSAAKHQGQALYKLARAGKATPVKMKTIEISQMEVLDVRLPFVRFRVECSSGTYIRSLAHSLGMRLGCGAVLTELTREYSHPFSLAQAHTLDAIVAQPHCLQDRVMPITQALPHWPVLTLTDHEEAKLKNGTPLAYGSGTVTALPQEGIGNLTLDGHLPAQEGIKAILLSHTGIPLALAEMKWVQNAAKKDQPKLMWTVLRGLWTLD